MSLSSYNRLLTLLRGHQRRCNFVILVTSCLVISFATFSFNVRHLNGDPFTSVHSRQSHKKPDNDYFNNNYNMRSCWYNNRTEYCIVSLIRILVSRCSRLSGEWFLRSRRANEIHQAPLPWQYKQQVVPCPPLHQHYLSISLRENFSSEYPVSSVRYKLSKDASTIKCLNST